MTGNFEKNKDCRRTAGAHVRGTEGAVAGNGPMALPPDVLEEVRIGEAFMNRYCDVFAALAKE